MRNMTNLITVLILIALTSSSCEKIDTEKAVPNCIERKINKIKKEEVKNPPISIFEWKVDGETYYYISSGCCDQYNYLYDDKCNEVCAPDGGFTGTGDGNCPEFRDKAEITLVWEDDRL